MTLGVLAPYRGLGIGKQVDNLPEMVSDGWVDLCVSIKPLLNSIWFSFGLWPFKNINSIEPVSCVCFGNN